VAELEAAAGAEAVEALERAGLIEVGRSSAGSGVSLAHPLYGEVLRARPMTLTRRRLLLVHAERISCYGARRREDPLRIATWRRDATGTADPGLLLTAARLARYAYDLPQVVRLARVDVLPGAVRDRHQQRAQLLVGAHSPVVRPPLSAYPHALTGLACAKQPAGCGSRADRRSGRPPCGRLGAYVAAPSRARRSARASDRRRWLRPSSLAGSQAFPFTVQVFGSVTRAANDPVPVPLPPPVVPPTRTGATTSATAFATGAGRQRHRHGHGHRSGRLW
jgi:hypothetical protein